MELLFIGLIGGLNFVIAAVYLCTRPGNYPFWVYLVAALFCWWPLVIFPALFHADKRALPAGSGRRHVAVRAYRLSLAAVAGTMLSQGCMGLYARLAHLEQPLGAMLPVYAAFVSLTVTMLLIYAVKLLQESGRE